MSPLTDDEAALVYHVSTWGSQGYPIRKLSDGKWIIDSFRSWKGFPTVYPTKKAAVEVFERWHTQALERWRGMVLANHGLIMTAVGIRGA